MATDTTVQKTPVMSVDDFKRTSEYLALTENQKMWILKLLGTHDARQATTETYKRCAKLGPAYTSQLAGKLAASPKIRAAIARFYDWDERTKFLNDLEHDIRKAKPGERANLMALRAKVLGLLPTGATPSATAPATDTQWTVGQRVQQRDTNGVMHYGVIKALDEYGQPSDIVEVAE